MVVVHVALLIVVFVSFLFYFLFLLKTNLELSNVIKLNGE